jgi:pentatricopeptide repeat protein
MLQERCVPNVITYNSLITACAQVGCSICMLLLYERLCAPTAY